MVSIGFADYVGRVLFTVCVDDRQPPPKTFFDPGKRLGYVRNPRSLMEGTETLCRDDIGDLLGSPNHL